jgi:hypothetical protein
MLLQQLCLHQLFTMRCIGMSLDLVMCACHMAG